MLPESPPRAHSSIVWRVRGDVFPWAKSPVGVLCCSSSPGFAVLPCAASCRPAGGVRVLDLTFVWYDIAFQCGKLSASTNTMKFCKATIPCVLTLFIKNPARDANGLRRPASSSLDDGSESQCLDHCHTQYENQLCMSDAGKHSESENQELDQQESGNHEF